MWLVQRTELWTVLNRNPRKLLKDWRGPLETPIHVSIGWGVCPVRPCSVAHLDANVWAPPNWSMASRDWPIVCHERNSCPMDWTPQCRCRSPFSQAFGCREQNGNHQFNWIIQARKAKHAEKCVRTSISSYVFPSFNCVRIYTRCIKLEASTPKFWGTRAGICITPRHNMRGGRLSASAPYLPGMIGMESGASLCLSLNQECFCWESWHQSTGKSAASWSVSSPSPFCKVFRLFIQGNFCASVQFAWNLHLEPWTVFAGRQTTLSLCHYSELRLRSTLTGWWGGSQTSKLCHGDQTSSRI